MMPAGSTEVSAKLASLVAAATVSSALVTKLTRKGREEAGMMDFQGKHDSSYSTAVIRVTIWLFDYDNFIARVQRNCLNKQTEF